VGVSLSGSRKKKTHQTVRAKPRNRSGVQTNHRVIVPAENARIKGSPARCTGKISGRMISVSDVIDYASRSTRRRADIP
jgi:hypothetical protein